MIDLGGPSEREFSERIVKIKEKTSKVVNEIRDDLAKMDILKAESLKKIEEMRRSAEENLEKLERESAKSKDLVPESLGRISVELERAKDQIKQKYEEIKARISASITLT